MAAFQTKYVSPVKHTCSVWQPRKTWVPLPDRCPTNFMYVCYAFQATQKLLFGYRYNFLKQEMCLRNTDTPDGNKVKILQKSRKSYILTPPHPKGHGMSVKCEQSIDGLTVKVWLLYHHPNFKYCTLFESGTELRTDRRTDIWTEGLRDDPITRCPRRTFQAGGIKIKKIFVAYWP